MIFIIIMKKVIKQNKTNDENRENTIMENYQSFLKNLSKSLKKVSIS